MINPGVKGPNPSLVLLFGAESYNGDGSTVKIVGADDNFGHVVGDFLDLVSPFAGGLRAVSIASAPLFIVRTLCEWVISQISL